MSILSLRNSEIAKSQWDLATLVSELRTSRAVLEQIVEDLAAALFPTHYGNRDLTDESVDYFVGNTLNSALTDLAEQVRRGLFFVSSEDIENDASLNQAQSLDD